MPLPLFIAETADGFEIRQRDGSIVSSHPTLRDGDDAALAAIVKHDGFAPKASRFADGAWRWIDMTAVEDAPGPDGSQVTERGIRAMAERLNAGDPIPVDGGTGDSRPHAQLVSTDARANGWIHVGAEVVHADGRLHLWGLAEVLPAIARDMDTNRLALGSIGFATPIAPDGQRTNDDAMLVQHALTNVPAVPGLTPAGSPRSLLAFRSRPLAPEIPMTTTLHQRGPAADALAAIYKLLEIDPTAPDAMWQLHDRVEVLHRAAASEAITEATGADEGATDEGAAADETAIEAARSRTMATALRSEVVTLRARVAELEPLAEKLAKREREDVIDDALEKRRISPARRTAYIEIAEKDGVDAALRAITAAHVPPADPLPLRAHRSLAAPESAGKDEDAAIATAKRLTADPAWRAKYPDQPEHHLFARALREAKRS